jgi:hypothetical protein
VRISLGIHDLQAAILEADAQRWTVLFDKAVLAVVPVNADNRGCRLLIEPFEALAYINLYAGVR